MDSTQTRNIIDFENLITVALAETYRFGGMADSALVSLASHRLEYMPRCTVSGILSKSLGSVRAADIMKRADAAAARRALRRTGAAPGRWSGRNQS